MFNDTMRDEFDSFGKIQVPSDKYWGAQTQRSLQFFDIGVEKMPIQIIQALALVKKCAAAANHELGLISAQEASIISSVAQEIIDRKHDDHFPLSLWQTGSGTQSNMNVNEVIANICNHRLGHAMGGKKPIHPNDHVNKSQSSNDCFPTAMHIAIWQELSLSINAYYKLKEALLDKALSWQSIIKVGRTHMQDATPMTLGQEFGAFAYQVEQCINDMVHNAQHLLHIAQGGTAVGTGLNCPPNFDSLFAKHLSKELSANFQPSPNKFAGLAAHDELVRLSASLNTTAVALMKIANDVRLLGSGPRCGIGELILPENEPGSSIMPGKVNPTQCEAMTMACAAVIGNHVAVTIGGSNGHLQLNTFKPLIAYKVLQSIRLLKDCVNSFCNNCIRDLDIDNRRIDDYVSSSLMTATALNPHIGYDKAGQIAKKAHHEHTSLKQAALSLGYLDEEEFEKIVDPKKMIGPCL